MFYLTVNFCAGRCWWSFRNLARADQRTISRREQYFTRRAECGSTATRPGFHGGISRGASRDQGGFNANLVLDGSTILLGPESVAKFQGDYLELDHGSVSVGTSKGFRVEVNCIRVVPVRNEWTQYEVSDVSGTVQVAARKDDVNVEHEGGHGKTKSQTAR